MSAEERNVKIINIPNYSEENKIIDLSSDIPIKSILVEIDKYELNKVPLGSTIHYTTGTNKYVVARLLHVTSNYIEVKTRLYTFKKYLRKINKVYYCISCKKETKTPIDVEKYRIKSDPKYSLDRDIAETILSKLNNIDDLCFFKNP